MNRTIAIVAGGDSRELVVSLRSAQGLYSFIDKERYNLYICLLYTSACIAVQPLKGSPGCCHNDHYHRYQIEPEEAVIDVYKRQDSWISLSVKESI